MAKPPEKAEPAGTSGVPPVASDTVSAPPVAGGGDVQGPVPPIADLSRLPPATGTEPALVAYRATKRGFWNGALVEEGEIVVAAPGLKASWLEPAPERRRPAPPPKDAA